MKLVVISPEEDRADEVAVLEQLFAAGLERYHVRKPKAGRAELGNWIARIPLAWRSRLVLHQHHDLVGEFCLGGRHWRDEDGGQVHHSPRFTPCGRGRFITSHSCHDLGTLRSALGVYHAVFFGPVFSSISKPGYGPRDPHIGEALGAILHTRSATESQTAVIAIGGVNCETALRAESLGFDGVAVLGAIWRAGDPLAEFRKLQNVCGPQDATAALGADRPRSCVMRPPGGAAPSPATGGSLPPESFAD